MINAAPHSNANQSPWPSLHNAQRRRCQMPTHNVTTLRGTSERKRV